MNLFMKTNDEFQQVSPKTSQDKDGRDSRDFPAPHGGWAEAQSLNVTLQHALDGHDQHDQEH